MPSPACQLANVTRLGFEHGLELGRAHHQPCFAFSGAYSTVSSWNGGLAEMFAVR